MLVGDGIEMEKSLLKKANLQSMCIALVDVVELECARPVVLTD
jgi:hypothetical protein